MANNFTKSKVAVLGSGPMGLSVAYHLVKHNYEPFIFEADDRIGGMTACFDFEGLSIERFYHFHCTSDSGLFRILNELGIEDKMRWKQTKMGYFYKDKILPWGNPFALLSFPDLSLVSKFRYGLHAFISTKKNNWKRLDKINAVSWIKRWVGEDAYKLLWEKLFEYKFYELSNNISAAWIWSRIRRIGRSRYNIFKEKLGYLEGGSNTLLQAMRKFIEEKGGKFYLKSPVSKVLIEKNKAHGIYVNNKFLPFDKVISTIPLPIIPNIMPDLPKEILKKINLINNIAVICVIVKLKKKLTDNFWLNVNDPNMDIPGLVEYSNLRSLGNSHILYVPFYMPADNPKYKKSDQYFIYKVKDYLKRINASLNEDDFVALKASRYRYSQPICSPGFLNMLPPFDLPVENLWAADTSYYYPEDRGISESIDYGKKIVDYIISKK